MNHKDHTIADGTHVLDLNNRPWQAMKRGTKSIEVRANGAYSDFDHSQIHTGDTIRFINNETKESLEVRTVDTRHYKTVQELLETEGTKRTLSSGKNVAGGIESIHSIIGYKEAIMKNGVFAIEIQPKQPLLIAHRGNTRDYPENTPDAFASAFELGADGIELDVHLNDKGKVIVVHDYFFDRSKKYPMLDEVLEKFSHKGRIEIEIKTLDLEAIEKVKQLIEKHQAQDFEITTSVIPLVPHIRAAFPNTLVGLIFHRWLIEDWMTQEFVSQWILKHLELSGANVLHLDVDLYNQKLASDLKRAGIVLHTHLKSADRAVLQKTINLGVNQCTFDDPETLKIL
ncbi:MAG: hypothetical protein H6774_00805 [Pseudomonadales bacterium]|nr:hypothetical protein [Pseudomonadales bacterium]